MKRYVLIPDSFKGTISSVEICRIVSEAIRAQDPEAAVCAIPVADGGEGTVDAFLAALGGECVEMICKGPYGKDMSAHYAMLPDGTAVIEMAMAAGLPLVGETRNPEKTTTYGVGQMIAHALHNGAGKIVLGLGGSATNDGGCGAAAALGVQFFNKDGKTFVPIGGTLKDICHISTDKMDSLVRSTPFFTMCDIDNPLCGENGASAIFGPQKGADSAMVKRLDSGLQHLAAVIRQDLGLDILDLPGSGAAGGFGGGSVAFFSSRLQMGINIILDMANFDQQAADADLVITGEGKLDSQSLRGKVVIGVARRAKALGVPVVALVGGCETDIAALYDEGVCGVFPINPLPAPFEEVKHQVRDNLRFTADNLFHFINALNAQF